MSIDETATHQTKKKAGEREEESWREQTTRENHEFHLLSLDFFSLLFLVNKTLNILMRIGFGDACVECINSTTQLGSAFLLHRPSHFFGSLFQLFSAFLHTFTIINMGKDKTPSKPSNAGKPVTPKSAEKSKEKTPKKPVAENGAAAATPAQDEKKKQ